MKTKGEMVMDMFAAAASSMITMNVIDFSVQCSRTHFNRMRNTRQHSALCVFALFSSIFNYREEAEEDRADGN